MPDFTGNGSDSWLLIETTWLQLNRYDLNHDHNLSVIPTDHSFIRSSPWGTLSKALEKSKYIQSVCFFSVHRLLKKSSNCCSAICFYRNQIGNVILNWNSSLELYRILVFPVLWRYRYRCCYHE